MSGERQGVQSLAGASGFTGGTREPPVKRGVTGATGQTGVTGQTREPPVRRVSRVGGHFFQSHEPSASLVPWRCHWYK